MAEAKKHKPAKEKVKAETKEKTLVTKEEAPLPPAELQEASMSPPPLPTKPKGKSKRKNMSEIDGLCIGQDGTSPTPWPIEIVSFPIKHVTDSETGDKTDDYVTDTEDMVVNPSAKQLALLVLLKQAALTRTKATFGNSSDMKSVLMTMETQLAIMGCIARVALSHTLYDFPTGFYILLPPIEQPSMLQGTWQTSAAKTVSEVKGWTALVPPRGPPLGYNSAYVSFFCVHPSFQGNGVANQLLDDMVSQCRQFTTANQIEINTDANDADAHAFLKAHDFHLLSVRNGTTRWSYHLPFRPENVKMVSS
jgi:ribosomal protein S18 acetylase RimI-like enzyme